MGFLLQLKLLLWKNYTLKKRKPVMLIFEVIIPLVLFVIVIGIRHQQPEVQYPAEHFPTWPLPSSGIIAILQSFCDRGPTDAYGFPTYPNSTVSDLLSQLNTVGENNNFFQPGFSVNELGEIPGIYRNFVEDPIMLKEALLNDNSSWSLVNLFDDPSRTEQYLIQNMSLNPTGVRFLVHNTILNKSSILSLLFANPNISSIFLTGNHISSLSDIPSSIANVRHKRSSPLPLPVLDSLLPVITEADQVHESVPIIREGLIYQVLRNEGFNASMLQQFTRTSIPPGSVEDLASALKKILLNSANLDIYVCGHWPGIDSVIRCDLSGEKAVEECQAALNRLKSEYCALSPAEKAQINEVLFDQASVSRISKLLEKGEWSKSPVRGRIHNLAKNLQTFLVFKKSIRALSKLAKSLPRDSCVSEHHKDLAMPTKRPQQQQIRQQNFLGKDEDFNKTAQVKTTKQRLPHAFSRVWKSMQRAMCGKEYNYNADEVNSVEDLGLSQSQLMKVGLMAQVLYNNPKILYAPSGTAADDIIKEANQTFVLFDKMNQYAKRMVEVGREMREYLNHASTDKNLKLLAKIQIDLRGTPLRSLLIDEPTVQEFIDDDGVTARDTFLNELETISLAACSWIKLMEGINFNIFEGFDSEDVLLNYFEHKAFHDNATVLAGLVFQMNDDGSLPNHMIYKIRQNASFTFDTTRVRQKFDFPGPRSCCHPYYQFGFLWVQDAIERAMINLFAGKKVTAPGSYMQQLPYPCYIKDEFLFMIRHVMPLCLTISWVYSVAMLVQHIVYEKEQRLKEVMKMMGLKNGVHNIAWFISSFVQMTVSVVIMTMMLKFGKILTYSNPLLVFVTLELYAVTIIMFSFLVSVLYSKAKIAAACAGLFYFLSYIPYMYISVREETANEVVHGYVKAIASILAPTAFGLGAKYFAFYEVVGVGIQWNNFAKSPAEDDEYHLGAVVLMLCLDCFLYGILVWYIGNVHPGAIGIPKPWHFPLHLSYWCGQNRNKRTDNSRNWWSCFCCRSSEAMKISEHEQLEILDGDDELFEPDPENLILGVSMVNLCKRYKGSRKFAVKNLNLNFYEGQITALLGHNGAGKTTTISILTGLFPSTSGSATIYGQDIETKMDAIRHGKLGTCPQHNILFDDLTVEEHMWLYTRLKGSTDDDFDIETEKLIADLRLPDKRDQKVKCLSGGMKRKLSVAIAFVGASRTVILDEPTAGVDPYARRAIWDLIIKYKKGRTIILTTHHMDEADILADRIAVMEDGKLKCCGSPLYLKHRLGKGYHLTIVKKMDETRMSLGSLCVNDNVTAFVMSIVPTARLTRESKHEIHYVLPLAELRAGNFKTLFNQLEESKEKLLISSYGVKNTTLEEIFLQVITERRESLSGSVSVSHGDDADAESNLQPCGNEELVCQVNDVRNGVLDANLNNDGDSANVGQEATQDEQGNVLESASCSQDIKTVSSSRSRLNFQHSSSADKNEGAALLSTETAPTVVKASHSHTNCEGVGQTTVEGEMLMLQQFWAIIIKRYLCTRKNIEGLFSQILLPAFFVSVAMSVALASPKFVELPELVLSPSQYYNLTQPRGNAIAFANNFLDLKEQLSLDVANSADITATFFLPSGIGATCVMRYPAEKSLRIKFSDMNSPLDPSNFDSMCHSVFRHGVYVPNSVPGTGRKGFMGTSNSTNPNLYADKFRPGPHQRKYPICTCNSENTGYVCPAYGYYVDPKSYHLVTNDVLIDISGQNESQYYLYTTNMFRLRRYGGLSVGHIRDMIPAEFGRDSPSLFRTIGVRQAAKIWYNNKGYHSMPTFLNVMNNAILRANLPDQKGSAYGITLINHPFPKTQSYFSYDEILQGNDALIAMFIIVAMSFVPASFVLFLVYEKSNKSKHLQLICGVHRGIYWVANYIWDICSYTVPASFCIGILLIFDIPAYTSPTNFPAVVSLFLLYGWSITPVMYPASFLFKEPSSAYICMIVLNLFVGITCLVTSFLLEVFSANQFLAQIYYILKIVFLIFPNYCLGRGLMDVAFNEYYNVFFAKSGQHHKIRSPFSWDLVSRNLVAMAATGLVFFGITLLCEFKFFRINRKFKSQNKTVEEDDIDVAAEKRRVLRSSNNEDLLHVENLVKVYQARTGTAAVNQLCWGVPVGECFGLLGVNGAGKSSTFRMLTGDTPITSGDAFIDGHSVKNELKHCNKYIGYCPQFDALYDELSAREHLALYSRLRGVPRQEIDHVVEWGLKKLDLLHFADRAAGTLSLGNKRKVSTAIALIGGPSLIFLDEPTTGMDPYSKRFLWDLIQTLVKDGRSIVFTSHSMEECEVLCTRVAIMVNGKFKCLGSTQHLKNRFGDGYSITLKTKTDHETRKVHRFFRRTFPNARLKEKHHNSLHYEISSQFVHLGEIFDKMEKAMSERESSIQEYSVSQNTLDNVFINFVKNQNDCDLEVPEVDMSLHSRNMSDMSANIVLDMSLPAGSQCDRIEEQQDPETANVQLLPDIVR